MRKAGGDEEQAFKKPREDRSPMADEEVENGRQRREKSQLSMC